jgi:hypothetical protein
MARTVHHVRDAHRTSNCDNHTCNHANAPWRLVARACDHDGPGHEATTLRYSARDLARATRTGTRPMPAATRVVTPRHISYGRHYYGHAIAEIADLFESRARTRIGEDLTAARRAVNAALRAGDGTEAPGAADEFDLAPTRHRHGAIYDAW